MLSLHLLSLCFHLHFHFNSFQSDYICTLTSAPFTLISLYFHFSLFYSQRICTFTTFPFTMFSSVLSLQLLSFWFRRYLLSLNLLSLHFHFNSFHSDFTTCILCAFTRSTEMSNRSWFWSKTKANPDNSPFRNPCRACRPIIMTFGQETPWSFQRTTAAGKILEHPAHPAPYSLY